MKIRSQTLPTYSFNDGKSISRLQSLILGTSSRSLSFDMRSSCSLDIPSRSSSRLVSWFESQDLTSSSRHAQDGNARLDAMTLVIPGKGERSAAGSSTSAPSKSLDSSTSLTFSMDSEDLSPSIQSLTDFSPLIASVRFRSRTTSLLRNITSFICCAEQTSFLPNSVTFCTAQVVENVTTLLPLLQKSCWRHSYGIRTSRLSPPPTFHIFSSPPRRAVHLQSRTYPWAFVHKSVRSLTVTSPSSRLSSRPTAGLRSRSWTRRRGRQRNSSKRPKNNERL